MFKNSFQQMPKPRVFSDDEGIFKDIKVLAQEKMRVSHLVPVGASKRPSRLAPKG